jgi:hypothetical protein
MNTGLGDIVYAMDPMDIGQHGLVIVKGLVPFFRPIF